MCLLHFMSGAQDWLNVESEVRISAGRHGIFDTIEMVMHIGPLCCVMSNAEPTSNWRRPQMSPVLHFFPDVAGQKAVSRPEQFRGGFGTKRTMGPNPLDKMC